MINFKALLSLNIGRISFGLFQYLSKDEIFSKDEFELELSKARKKLVKELEEDIITDQAKEINESVKEIETILADLKCDEAAKEQMVGLLTNISNTLFVDPGDYQEIVDDDEVITDREEIEKARVQQRRKERKEADELVMKPGPQEVRLKS